jgi:hypothetical protein
MAPDPEMYFRLSLAVLTAQYGKSLTAVQKHKPNKSFEL